LVNLEGLGVARVNLGWVEAACNALRNPDLRKGWRESLKPLRADQRDHAKGQEGPSGAWAGRSPLTMQRRGTLVDDGKRKYRRPRKLMGKLPTALTSKVTRTGVSLISRAKWSGVHQDGGRAGQGASIPARPFLWASQEALEAIGYVLSRHLKIQFEKTKG
jgi:phage gpG-like protein